MRLISFLATIFCKWPVYDQWNPEVPYNVNTSALLITYVAGNTLFDLLTLSLPLVALRGLQMDTHRKVMLSTVFSFGSMSDIRASSLIELVLTISVAVLLLPSSVCITPFSISSLLKLLLPSSKVWSHHLYK